MLLQLMRICLVNLDDAPNAVDWDLWPQGNNENNNNVVNMEVQLPEQNIGEGETFLEVNYLAQANVANFYLNEHLDDEFGGVDDILPLANDAMEVNDLQGLTQGEIIEASSQFSELVDNAPLLDLNEPVHMDVFIPIEDGKPLQMMPDEFPMETGFMG